MTVCYIRSKLLSFFPTFSVSPVVTEHPPDQNVTSFEGTIMLSCTATGFPAPTITWFHNDTLENSVFYTTEDINCYTTRSTFIKLRAETNDSGTYFCRAEINGYDSVDSNEAIVLVQGEFPIFIATSFYPV